MKLFSPDRVNTLIPVLQPLVDELWDKRRALAILLLEHDLSVHAPGGTDAVPVRPYEDRRLMEVKAEVIRLINRIESHGCILKDVDLGLLDFPSLRGQRAVFLCWKSGETEISHWHGTDETYADRKAL